LLYIFADWVLSENGYFPDLPENCGFLCLAGSSEYSSFGLFEVSNPSDEAREALRVRSVPPELELLLRSASNYPPALAGALHALNSLAISDRNVFMSELERLLRDRLNGQQYARHVLLRSLITEDGYREEGEYVWVVGYRPQAAGREVSWLASDYQVYSDAVESFDVSPTWLAERFGVSDTSPVE
jgi:hypothetical protein